MESIKALVLNRLTARVAYIAAAFSTSHLVSLASSQFVQGELAKAGVTFVVNDPAKLQAYLVALMLVGGEIAFHFVEKRFTKAAPKGE